MTNVADTAATAISDERWLVTAGPDGANSKIVVGWEALQAAIIDVMGGDREDVEDMLEQLDEPDEWDTTTDHPHWRISWAFEDGYLNVQQITELQERRRNTLPSSVTDDADEAYEIGKRDGYAEAVQDIDQLTGGDGEYRVSLDIGSGVNEERHCPDPATMKARIAARFSAAALPPSRDDEVGVRPLVWPVQLNWHGTPYPGDGEQQALSLANCLDDYAQAKPLEARLNHAMHGAAKFIRDIVSIRKREPAQQPIDRATVIEAEERLPTREEARQAAAVLLLCNGHDLDVWTNGEWPCDMDTTLRALSDKEPTNG